ncbi:15502_t:CDS:2 [Entrophospora sp. SA101]|nr:15502_t:CDS:2 [Entrophospora sp. SA101]
MSDRFVELTDILTLSQVYKKGGFDYRIPERFKHDISFSHNKTFNDKISLIAAGPGLRGECRELGGCPTGDAKITKGYDLPAKYIIHTVGPVGEHEELLNSAYRRSLEVMIDNNLKSIAFSNISTGVYGYPRVGAAQVAMKTIRKWMDDFEHIEKIDRIIFCVFEESNRKIYEGLLPLYFPPPPEGSDNDADILEKQEKENDAGTAEKQEEVNEADTAEKQEKVNEADTVEKQEKENEADTVEKQEKENEADKMEEQEKENEADTMDEQEKENDVDSGEEQEQSNKADKMEEQEQSNKDDKMEEQEQSNKDDKMEEQEQSNKDDKMEEEPEQSNKDDKMEEESEQSNKVDTVEKQQKENETINEIKQENDDETIENKQEEIKS